MSKRRAGPAFIYDWTDNSKCLVQCGHNILPSNHFGRVRRKWARQFCGRRKWRPQPSIRKEPCQRIFVNQRCDVVLVQARELNLLRLRHLLHSNESSSPRPLRLRITWKDCLLRVDTSGRRRLLYVTLKLHPPQSRGDRTISRDIRIAVIVARV
jgi:hypothetical protein